MNILEEIIEHKRAEVKERRSLFPVSLLERSVYFNGPVVSLRKYLLRPGSSGVIAEFKRRSPSRGDINPYADIERTSIGYMMAGASALSVLTDGKYFGGSSADLTTARKFNFCPILRKDFIVDEYQVIEARSIGADAILLIAAALNAAEVKELARFAHSLGLEVLLELHDDAELDRVGPDIDLVGVNSRNLKDFTVDLAIAEGLAPKLKGITKVAESGIQSTADVARLRKAGYSGFLMGEYFMKHSRPERACEAFIQEMSAR